MQLYAIHGGLIKRIIAARSHSRRCVYYICMKRSVLSCASRLQEVLLDSTSIRKVQENKEFIVQPSGSLLIKLFHLFIHNNNIVIRCSHFIFSSCVTIPHPHSSPSRGTKQSQSGLR